MTPGKSPPVTPTPGWTGSAKLAYCQRLGNDWRRLADLLRLEGHETRAFARGDEPRALWQWLEQRGRLGELPGLLQAIKRPDLADELVAVAGQVAGRATDDWYQQRLDRWSGDRYRLDHRFVHLNLLIDRGEEADGVRWEPAWLRTARYPRVAPRCSPLCCAG